MENPFRVFWSCYAHRVSILKIIPPHGGIIFFLFLFSFASGLNTA
jgi:hypothetical protein